MKKKINSRDKGQRGERQLVKQFENWWKSDFFRTPGSGAFATMGFNSDTLDLSGDIMTLDESFPFCVESKNAEGWHLEQLLTAPKSKIIAWWQQTLDETPEGKLPLLVFKKNRHPTLFMMPLDTWIEHTTVSASYHPTFIVCGVVVKVGLFDELLETDPTAWQK